MDVACYTVRGFFKPQQADIKSVRILGSSLERVDDANQRSSTIVGMNKDDEVCDGARYTVLLQPDGAHALILLTSASDTSKLA